MTMYMQICKICIFGCPSNKGLGDRVRLIEIVKNYLINKNILQ